MEDQLNVLVLEPLNDDFKIIEEELLETKLNLKIIHITTKEEFLNKLDTIKADLIVSNYNIENYDGKQALIDSKNKFPQAPFIFVTSSINEEIAVDCIKSGAADYVTKEHI